jgi:Fur family ferric uptake transcriptional regulator
VTLPAVTRSQTPEDKFREYLASRKKPQRFTEQQRDLVNYIFNQHNHFDAEKLIDEMKAAGFTVSRATVYRTLAKLVDAGLLRTLEMGPRTLYEHDYGYPAHDHMHCEKCDKMIEFQSPELEEALQAVCAEQNFNAEGHTLILRGICAECNRASLTKRRLDMI